MKQLTMTAMKGRRYIMWGLLTRSRKLVGLTAGLLAILAVAAQPAQAALSPYTFSFDDMIYYGGTANLGLVNTALQNAFGTPATQYVNSANKGWYQATVLGGLTAGSTGLAATTTDFLGAGTAIGGEFQRGTATPQTAGLYLVGSAWSGNTVSSTAVAGYVSSSQANPYFRYYTGASSQQYVASLTETAFTLNSLDLAGSGTVTVTARDVNGVAIAGDTATLTLTGAGSFQTLTLNWLNVGEVDFSGPVSMDNVVVNNDVAPVPEPTTMVAGAGALGLALLGIGRARRSNVVRIGK